MKKVLNEKDKWSLQKTAKAQLERLEAIANDEVTNKKINDFKLKFAICEIVYKILLKKHQNDIKKAKSQTFKILFKQVKPALDYAGYDCDTNLLIVLFSTNTRVGERTVKTIRDVLTHDLSQSAINELINREDEFYRYMNQFLDMIRFKNN